MYGPTYYLAPEEYEVWTLRSGQEIKVSSMSPAHLVNTINLLEKTTTPMAPYMLTDTAQDGIDAEHDNAAEHKEAWLFYLNLELEKRDLTPQDYRDWGVL